jgi:hypothetical protein
MCKTKELQEGQACYHKKNRSTLCMVLNRFLFNDLFLPVGLD